MDRRDTAYILCLFLGFLGVHKFYENKIGMGILYLLTGGLFGIGWLVDVIIYICQESRMSCLTKLLILFLVLFLLPALIL